MAKKQEKFACDNCKYFTDKCEHQSNLLILLNKRIEKVTYKSLDKKEDCEHCTVKDYKIKLN